MAAGLMDASKAGSGSRTSMAMMLLGAESAASSSSCGRLSIRRSNLKLGLRVGVVGQHQQHNGRCRPLLVKCSSNGSSSNANGTNGGHEEDAEDYLPAHVVDAVSMLPLHGRLFMTLANGREVEVNHIHPSKGRLLYRARNPAIFLKVVNDSDVLLPIIVGESAVAMLMKALHDEERLGRPNHYQLLKQIVGALDYEAKMVRITERIKDTYYARIYFGQEGKEELSSVDARPSDAINFAVRCKIPIYVNRSIVDSDAVRPVYTTAVNWESTERSQKSSSYLDSPDEGHDPIAEEITLMKEMLVAVVEERYADAARCRDQLNKLRLSFKMKQQLF